MLKLSDDEDLIIVWHDDRPGQRQRYEFPQEFFENDAAYMAFHELLSQRCVNITNR